MKKLHLLCNAHLDPAWIWRRHDGLAESISTFRVAADFCEQFDGYVFNHNESLLYEWVEEHEPPLFERIKRLVAEGKWHIMGGWYIQPDCVMPSGESFISQIKIGREYFKEKFGVVPKTAINFDSFGHTRGLAQILKLFDYDSYIVTRPGSFKQDFLWEGYDGSTVLVHAGFEAYGSLKGTAVERIKKYIAENNDKETGLLLWGMGNHGGGPSRIDLQEIAEFVKETDVEVIHSNERDYFAEIDKENLNTVDTSLIPCMVGCYTSMVRIKQGNRRLENKIAVTEKLMSYAALMTDFKYDTHCLDEAKKALAFCQFHDVLPGSGIKAVEDDALRTLGYGEEIVDRCYYKAFIKLCQGQKVAESGKVIPVMVLNPHPYEVEDVFTVDYVLENQNRHDDEYTVAEVYDEDGNRIFAQNEKSESTIDLDWAKKVSFHARVAPSSVTRFNCIMKVKKIADLAKPDYPDDFITVKNDRMETVVNMKTGFIESYKVDGKTLATDFGALEVYNDNEDPWGMTVKSFTDYDASFKLMTAEQANEFIGYPDEKLPPVRVTEDGDARIIIQSFWYYKNSRAVVEYIIPKHDSFIDINVTLHSNEPNKMVKYRINTAFDPYEVEDVFTVDYVLENQNRHDDEYTVAEVYDEDGNRIFAQNEKSESTIDLDWAKKVSFHARVAPSSVTRFNCIMKVKKIADLAKPDYPDDFITVKNDRMETVVNMKTGFIESYKVDGKTLATDFGALEVYNDNEDPWGMTVKSFTDYDASFKLMTAEQANEFIGYPDEKLPPVRVTEDGDARIIIQSFWYYKNSRAVVEYIIPKHDSFIDINVTLHSNEPNKMVKYRINTAFDGTPYGQTAFGTEALFDNNDEAVFQKWCAIKNDESSLAVYNCGIYGGSFTGNTIRLSLLRTPIYSGHPVGQKPIAPHNRFLDHIDIGERKFSFRLDTAENVDKKAQIYNEKIETLSFFPSGEGEKLTTAITIDNHDVLLSSMRKEGDKYRLTLYNSKNADSTATVNLKSKSVKVEFGKYQVKLIEI